MTFEDLLEELVGDVFREHDESLPKIEREAGGSALVRGEVPIREVNRELGLALDESESTSTIARCWRLTTGRCSWCWRLRRGQSEG